MKHVFPGTARKLHKNVAYYIWDVCRTDSNWFSCRGEATDGNDAGRLLDVIRVLLNFLLLSGLAGDLWPCGCVLIC